ncbi:MAG: tRNA (N6-isopentenyl adenosine(37)-C2)-methylthiotransferase MiaB, partial [Proteobacteria bacterium]|nr:tRNA (N6-isopentenyl adenosine(37)-C2)-methylthiotransferase MiaB [Pseudomonadota bacterium]
IHTFGCQMNEADSERMLARLAARGWGVSRDPAEADLILVNTCTIRAKPEQKVFSLLGRLARYKHARPELVIGVGGCMAQQCGQDMLDRADHLDLVFGPSQVDRVPDLVEEVMRHRRPVVSVDLDQPPPRDEAPPLGPRDGVSPVRAMVTVMRGCSNFCAYCVVPFVRGPEVSRPADEVLSEVEARVAAGAREIILLGQNVNTYGRDRAGEIEFADLLTKAGRVPGLWRLRFVTSHPKDMSPELMDRFGRLDNLCPSLHLPVQSGSTRVLEAMGRGYTREGYLSVIERLRHIRPDIAFSADAIVGFPGETEQDFADTLDLIERVRFDSLYSFKYSDRPGVRSAGFANKVSEETMGRRLTILQARQRQITLNRNQALVGRTVEVLVEGPSKRQPTEMTGRTSTNKVVNFEADLEWIGRLATVRIEEAYANSLRGAPAT